MRRFTTLIVTCLSISFSASALASGDSVPNGRPFQELLSQVDENRELIEANQESINLLNQSVDTINSQIVTIDNQLTNLTTTVTGHSATISSALQRIADNEEDISTLSTDLETLSLQHQQDVSIIHVELDAIKTGLADIENQTGALSIELSEKFLFLQSQVNQNDYELNQMLSNIGYLNFRFNMLNYSYNLLNSRYSSLSTQLNNYNYELNLLEREIDILKSRVTNLESGSTPSDPCVSSIADGQRIYGTWTSACRSTHRSGRYARYYTFTIPTTRYVRIELNSSTDPYLYLLRGAGQSGTVYTSNDDGGPGLNSRIFRYLPAGTYTIEATTYSSGRTGSFNVYVNY